MSIKLQTVRWCNFLSTGNIFTEVALDESPTTLISGENGSGKSTILDALCFGLFNRPFRKINKPQLVNSVTNKKAVVEVEFEISNRKYLVRRGIKPAVFELYVDGRLINQSSDSRDYQQILEQNILKTNFKTFCQVVILGAANFTPFMQLPAASRREIIEDLLDIQVFSKMNVILKNKMATNRDQLVEVDHQINLTKTRIELNNAHRQQLKKNTESVIAKKNKLLHDASDDLEKLNERLKSKSDKLSALNDKISEKLPEITTKMQTASGLLSKLQGKIAKSQQEIEFYANSVNCPVCEQTISEQFKQVQVEQKTDKIKCSHAKIEQLNQSIDKFTKKKNILDSLIEQAGELKEAISVIKSNISFTERTISGLNKEIDELSHQNKSVVTNNEDRSILRQHVIEKQRLTAEKELYNVSSVLLKDGGIKSQIIKQYIPIINRLINKYLEQMEFFCQFEINEQFEEVIKSRFRDEFSYDSFSQGEKMRIDLALLFSWREISKMRNSTSTNILVFDEIMDSSLDVGGTEEFIKILGQLSGNSNIIVISHKSDQIQDKFERVIRFGKQKNFSKIL
jgi:DNA repair exonuclease SbcCD ATPase subunit